jgi:hypothetical protein
MELKVAGKVREGPLGPPEGSGSRSGGPPGGSEEDSLGGADLRAL